MKGYVYAVSVSELGLVKIGATGCPVTRLQALAAVTPHKILVRRVVLVGTTGQAKVRESQIKAEIDQFGTHGEWFLDGDHVDEAFNLVRAIDDVTESVRLSLREPARAKAKKRPREVFDALAAVAFIKDEKWANRNRGGAKPKPLLSEREVEALRLRNVIPPAWRDGKIPSFPVQQ